MVSKCVNYCSSISVFWTNGCNLKMCYLKKIVVCQAFASGHGIWISSFLSHEVRARSKIVPLRSGLLYASSIRPACNLLAYTGYLDLYFCMSLERSIICLWTSMCPPRTDLDNQQPTKQTNKHAVLIWKLAQIWRKTYSMESWSPFF